MDIVYAFLNRLELFFTIMDKPNSLTSLSVRHKLKEIKGKEFVQKTLTFYQ